MSKSVPMLKNPWKKLLDPAGPRPTSGQMIMQTRAFIIV